MNRRSEKFPEARVLRDTDLNPFKHINVHKHNPPYGVMKDKKGNFKMIHHYSSKEKPSAGYKVILFDRFAKRKDYPH